MFIELNKISKYYESGGRIANERQKRQEVLTDISLTVNAGDAIAIVGPSGSGKSTLLNIIGTLDTPTSGTVTFNGSDILSFDESALAKIRNRNIGFVFQQHYLLPQLTLIENVLLPVITQKDKLNAKTAGARAISLLNSVGLAEYIHKFPGQMSVGECQRAAVVRALINEPELILADEPTGSLDNESAQQLAELLSDLKNEYPVAMVIVTHSSELAKRMTSVYRLYKGKLITMNNEQ